MSVVVIGGGLSGLCCALRLAERGASVMLLEAAGSLGGRTRSFFDPQSKLWLDTGPHLLSGAYGATQALLQRIGADAVHWQRALSLALFDPEKRRLEALCLSPFLWPPAALGAQAVRRFGLKCLRSLLRLGLQSPQEEETTQQWLARLRIDDALVHNWLAPLHLATLNAPLDRAPASSFRFVLSHALNARRHARLGWFRRSLQEALIEPLQRALAQRGVLIRLHARAQRIEATNQGVHLQLRNETIRAEAVVIATSCKEARRLLGQRTSAPTSFPITSLYVWAEAPALPQPLVGAIGTPRWWLDISAMRADVPATPRLFCAVASATPPPNEDERRHWIEELRAIVGGRLRVQRTKLVCERYATTLPVQAASEAIVPSERVIDASERPLSGSWPATIEFAVRRGQRAAEAALRALEGR